VDCESLGWVGGKNRPSADNWIGAGAFQKDGLRQCGHASSYGCQRGFDRLNHGLICGRSSCSFRCLHRIQGLISKACQGIIPFLLSSMKAIDSEITQCILGLFKAFGYGSGYNSINNCHSQKEFRN
jgi:hypothetical protein